MRYNALPLFLFLACVTPSLQAEKPSTISGKLETKKNLLKRTLLGNTPRKKETKPNKEATDSAPNVSLDANPQPKKLEPHPHLTQKLKPGETAEADIYLNFENASLDSILNYLAGRKKINVLPHKELTNTKVSLTTRSALTLERAWNILLTLLEMNGFSIIKVDNLFRVVQSQDASQHPIPIYSSKMGTEPENLPDSDLVVRYVYFFKNIKPEMAQNILSSMLGGDDAIRINEDLQACILKEKCFNIKAAMRIIKELDSGGLREAIKIIPLQEANAQEVADLFREILGEEQKRGLRFAVAGKRTETHYFSSSTKIIPEVVKNSLILLGTKKNLDRLTNFIYKYIDVPLGTAQSRIHIKEIRYAKAENIRSIVEKIILPPAGQKTDKSKLVGKFKFFEDVTISAETGTEEGRGGGNRLIIACNQEDWRRIESFIDKLDKPQPQIAFEVMVIIIDETQDKQLGAQLQSKEGKQLGLGINILQFNNLHSLSGISSVPQNGDDSGDGDGSKSSSAEEQPITNLIELAKPDILGQGSPSFLTLGKDNNIWSIIRSVLKLDNTQVVAQPYVITNNHQKCVVKVNDTRKVVGPLKQSEKGENRVATKVDKTAGTEVELTPHINSDGVVNLTINAKIDEFVPTADPDAPPKILRRVIDTRTSLLAGEVLVLGGLKKSNQTINLYKTPVLGDVPILGSLFKNKTKKKTEENLYVFIRPSIIKPKFQGIPDEYTQLKLDYAKYQMLKADLYAKDKDPIHRWFFRPSNYSIKRKLSDVAKGRFAPIDDFTYGKNQPRSVNIRRDPYFRGAESIKNGISKLKRRTRRT